MARVPHPSEQLFLVQPMTDAKFRAPDDGGGTEALGAGMQRLGRAGSAYADAWADRQARRDDAETRKADNALVTGWRDISAPWRDADGETGVKQAAVAGRALDDHIKAVRATLANDRQRGMFDRVAALRRKAWQAEIDRHEDVATRAFDETESQRRQALAIENMAAAAAADHTKGVWTNEEILLGEVRGRSRAAGLDAEATALADTRALGTAHAAVVEKLAEKDPLRAQAWLDAHRAEIGDAATLERLDRTLHPYVEERRAEDIVESIRGKIDGVDAQHAHADALGLEPGLATTVRAALTRRDRDDAAALREAREQAADKAWAIAFDPANTMLRSIPPSVYAALAPEEQQAIRRALDANAHGEDPPADPTLYLALAAKAASGELTMADARHAWGRLPGEDWERIAGWQREVAEQGASSDASALLRRVLAATDAIGPIGDLPDNRPYPKGIHFFVDGPGVRTGRYVNGPGYVGTSQTYRTDGPPAEISYEENGKAITARLYSDAEGNLIWVPYDKTAELHHSQAEEARARLPSQPIAISAESLRAMQRSLAAGMPASSLQTAPATSTATGGGSASAFDTALIEGAGLQSAANAPGARWVAPIADILRPYVMRGLRTPYGTAGLALGATAAVLAGRLNSSTDGVPQGPDTESFPAAPPRTPIATGLPIPEIGKAHIESFPSDGAPYPEPESFPALAPQKPIILSTPMADTALLSPVMRADDAGDSSAAKGAISGETAATKAGKSRHAERAEDRRASGNFDLVNARLVDANGVPIEVPKRVDLTTGAPLDSRFQASRPDAVRFKNGLILDDKPLGRPISKDRQQVIRFIESYRLSRGSPPNKIAIQRYDPITGDPIVTELYDPEEFIPRGQK
jgi:hypothetical protein